MAAGRTNIRAGRADALLRVAVLSVSGASRHRGLLAELEKSCVVRVLEPKLALAMRMAMALRHVHADPRVWRSSIAFGPATRRAIAQQMAPELKALRPDVVLALYPIVFDVPPVAPYVILTDNTLAVTRRLLPEWEPLTPARTQAAERAEAVVMRQAAFVAAESEQARQSLIRDYGVDGQKVINTGVATPLPIPSEYPERTSDVTDRLLFVGTRFAGRKGGEVLAAAWAEVLRVLPGAELAVVGPPRRRVPRLPSLTAYGPVAHADLPTHYAAARAYVHPAPFEASLPNTIREAMAYGLPVLAARHSAVEEYAPPIEHLYPPRDHRRLAADVIEVLSNRDAARSEGQRLHRYAREVLTWSVLAPKIERLLRFAAG